MLRRASIKRAGCAAAANKSNYNGLQFADAKHREQRPTAVAGFNSVAGTAKDCSSVVKIDPDRALISLKEMPITTVDPSHDAGEVACRKIRGLAIERAASVNHFKRRQNPALLSTVEFDGFVCEPCRNRL
jgi:hypothetical protein